MLHMAHSETHCYLMVSYRFQGLVVFHNFWILTHFSNNLKFLENYMKF
jgi:hypothetical protein